jgi:hypothetical protein
MALYRFHPLTIGSDQLDGIVDLGVSDGRQTIRPMSDGLVDPIGAFDMAESPRITAATHHIDEVLTLLGFGSVRGTVLAYDSLIADDGTKSASGATIYSLPSLVLPRSIMAQQDQLAVATVEAVGTGDLTVTVNQSLGAYTPTTGKGFSLGPVKVGATTLTQVVSSGIDFGIEEFMKRSDGAIAPTDAAIMSRMPVISVTSLNLGQRATVMGSGGKGGLCAATFELYFIQRSCGGIASGNVHVKITGAGAVSVMETSGSPRAMTVQIQPYRLAGAPLLTVSLASAPGPT